MLFQQMLLVFIFLKHGFPYDFLGLPQQAE